MLLTGQWYNRTSIQLNCNVSNTAHCKDEDTGAGRNESEASAKNTEPLEKIFTLQMVQMLSRERVSLLRRSDPRT